MTNKYYLKTTIVFAIIVLLTVDWAVLAKAQLQDERWSEIYRLSSGEGAVVGEGFVTADQYGYVHVFWQESLDDERSILQYSRFDGDTWTPPIDIFVTMSGIPIGSISPFVDTKGTIHLIWTVGNNGPAFYSTAPASGIVSAKSWQEPRQLRIPAREIKLVVDNQRKLHVIYTTVYGDQPGVFYTRSEDQGGTWSDSFWLDPDILSEHAPKSLQFSLDSGGGLHAVWYYISLDSVAGDWVRYTHSMDGGVTWTIPTTIDKNNGDANKLHAAEPVMAVQKQNVHIIWGSGTELIRRYHRFSVDAGQSWSAPIQLFGDLNGQAFDGITVDAAGRIHFFAQIRYPQGIYHAYRDQEHWTTPSLIYLIARDYTEEIGDRIHAHLLRPVIRAGNQIFLIFADSPSDQERELYVIHRALDDIPPSPLDDIPSSPLEPEVTPTPSLSETPTPSPTPAARPADLSLDNEIISKNVSASTPNSVISLAIIPVVMLITGVIVIQWWRQRH